MTQKKQTLQMRTTKTIMMAGAQKDVMKMGQFSISRYRNLGRLSLLLWSLAISPKAPAASENPPLHVKRGYNITFPGERSPNLQLTEIILGEVGQNHDSTGFLVSEMNGNSLMARQMIPREIFTKAELLLNSLSPAIIGKCSLVLYWSDWNPQETLRKKSCLDSPSDLQKFKELSNLLLTSLNSGNSQESRNRRSKSAK